MENTQPLHYKLLEEMSIDGVGYQFNVIPFVKNNFSYEVVNFSEERKKQTGRILFFFEDLISRGFITTDDNKDFHGWRYDLIDSKIEITYIGGSELYYTLTSAGLDYLDAYKASQASFELNKSYRNVNEASITNYIFQKNLALLTLVFAVASTIVSILNYVKSDETAASVDRLREQLKIELKKQEVLSTQITSPKVIPRKP